MFNLHLTVLTDLGVFSGNLAVDAPFSTAEKAQEARDYIRSNIHSILSLAVTGDDGQMIVIPSHILTSGVMTFLVTEA